MEQYLAFIGGKPVEEIVPPPPPASTPLVVTQQEKATLLATITARKVADFTGMVPHSLSHWTLPPSFTHPFTCSFQAAQVSPLP